MEYLVLDKKEIELDAFLFFILYCGGVEPCRQGFWILKGNSELKWKNLTELCAFSLFHLFSVWFLHCGFSVCLFVFTLFLVLGHLLLF